jgi:hypothetical protein
MPWHTALVAAWLGLLATSTANAAPAELPAAGSLYGSQVGALPVIGVGLIVLGLSLRLANKK